MNGLADGSQLLQTGAQFLGLLIDLNIKGFLIILVIWTLAAGQRKASASLRHLLWTAAFVIIPLIPLIPYLLFNLFGDFAQSLLAGIPTIPQLPLDDPSVFNDGVFSLAIIAVLVVWFVGATVQAARYLFGLGIARWYSLSHVSAFDGDRAAAFDTMRRSLGIRRPVRLLRNDRVQVPMTAGALVPLVVLPGTADDWSGERFRAVAMHELAHVRRWDYVIKFIAQAVQSFCWFNPLVWVAARRLHDEMEQACDDMVLQNGVRASEYALHLMDLARSMPRRPAFGASVLGLAARIGLKHRLETILNPGTNRIPASAARMAALAAVLTVVLFPLTATRTHNRENRQTTVAGGTTNAQPATRVASGGADSASQTGPQISDRQLTLEPVPSGPRENLNTPIVETPVKEKVAKAAEALPAQPTGGGADAILLRRLIPSPDDSNERLGGSSISSIFEAP